MSPTGTTRTRVLMVSAALNVGGAERQWAVLVPRLRSLGLDVSVLTLLGRGAFYDELARLGTPIRSAQLRHRADLPGLWRTVARPERADVVLTQSVAGQVVGAMIAARLRAPHVTAEHHPPGLPRRAHERALLRLVAPRVDAAVAVSPSQLPELAALGYRRDRIRIVPNAVDGRPETRERAEVRGELGLGANDFAALLVATLRPQKRSLLFIDAVARAHSSDARIRGLLAGGGPELPAANARAAQTGGVVRTLGERADVADLMNAADVVCLSSSAEGLPMALLEAMALGRPVVSTDVGGVGDAVVPEATGLLVPPDDRDAFARALVRLAGDPGLTARLGSAARKRHADRFGVDRMAGSYAELLESLAKRARLPPVAAAGPA